MEVAALKRPSSSLGAVLWAVTEDGRFLWSCLKNSMPLFCDKISLIRERCLPKPSLCGEFIRLNPVTSAGEKGLPSNSPSPLVGHLSLSHSKSGGR